MVSEQGDRTTTTRYEVLDHGYVQLVETWGSEERIIEAARMSTNKGFQGWGPIHSDMCLHKQSLDRNSGYPLGVCVCEPKIGDEKLLRYLYEHKHMTPFEMAGMTVEVQAPIFVFREWHRHRTQSYNELSARYTPLPDVNYVPTIERIMMDGGKNRQAQGLSPVTPTEAQNFQYALKAGYRESEERYQWALAHGVPKELARLPVPVGRYSRMRASANLRNWLQFLTLRLDSHAQWEIRQYAQAVGKLLSGSFPRTYALFEEK